MNSRRTESRNNGRSIASAAHQSRRDDELVVAALEEYFELLQGGSPPPRDEFLARHPAIASILADRLTGLELVHHAAGQFAETSPGRNIEDPRPPTILGEYRVIREVGRGGMGVVYEAEQLSLGRRVALKVLPSPASSDPRQCQRFQVEAQAAALLHHEHIVPVFGIGSDEGIHYYAMQFIDGRSLTEVIRELRPASRRDAFADASTSDYGPSRTDGEPLLPPPQSSGSFSNNRHHFEMTAQLGLQAALALEHAHEIGVIHRDIKPSNLLIDTRGHLWVADFGLARLPQEDHDLTRTGDLVGTLRYMSPEQVRGVRGGVDARTDIYGIGVTLYELLTLSPAFTARNRHELTRRILDEEPTSPRRRNPAIPLDLETIILKAMEKEPSDRYVSARELADELRRFLDDQPIQARRPSILDRSAKWSRRHRTVVIASTTALLVTLTVSTAALWEAKRRTDAALEDSRVAKRRTDVALEDAREAKRRTDVILQDLRLARSTEFRAVHNSLGMVDQIIRPLVAEARSGTSMRERAIQIVSFGVAYYEQISKDFRTDQRKQETVAMAFRQAGFARMSLGSTRGRRDYTEAIHIFEDLAARFPERVWYRAELIETLHEYAGLLTSPSEDTAADATFRRALAVAEALLGDKAADAHCFSSRLVGPFNSLAWELVHRPTVIQANDVALAIRLAERAVVWEPNQANIWNTLGVAHYRAANWPAAIEALRKSMALNNGGTAADWFFLAANLHHQGARKEARRWYDQAVTWVDLNPPLDQAQAAELKKFREEAAQVLAASTAAPERRG